MSRLDDLDIALGKGDCFHILAKPIEFHCLGQHNDGVFVSRATTWLSRKGDFFTYLDGTLNKRLSFCMAPLSMIKLCKVVKQCAQRRVFRPQRFLSDA